MTGISLWLLVRSLHVVSMVAWFAGLFYLPRLFVYQTQVSLTDSDQQARFNTMTRKLYRIIIVPASLATLFFGVSILISAPKGAYTPHGWIHLKLVLVSTLIIFQHRLSFHRKQFEAGRNQYSERYFRILNEYPTIILIAVVFLAIFRPF